MSRSSAVRTLLSLLAATALLATSCGGDEPDGGASASIAECPVDALDDVDEPVEIEMWHVEIGLNVRALEDIVERYHRSQDRVRVSLQYQGTVEEIMKKYEDSTAEPSSLPDIATPDDTATQYMIDSGTAVPAQACIDADPEAEGIYDDMVPIVNAAYRVEGQLWPGAFSASGAATFVNEAHFEAAGLDPSTDIPTTLDELRDVAERVQAAAIPGVETPMVMRIEAWPIEFLISGAEQPIVNNDNGRTSLATESLYDNDVSTRVFEFLSGMQDDGLLRFTDAADPFAAPLAMAAESASMLIESSSAIRTVDGAVNGTLSADDLGLGDEAGDLSGFEFPDLRLDVGEMPGIEGPGRGQMGGLAWYLVAGEDPAKVAASWDFMKFFNGTEQQVAWARDGSYFPVRSSAAESPELEQYWTETQSGRWMAEAYRGFVSLDPDFPGPIIGPYREFREAVRNGLQSVSVDEQTVPEAIEQIDERFQEALDGYVRDVEG